MNKLYKHIISFAIISLIVAPLIALPALAQTNDPNELFGINAVNNGLNGSLASGDPRAMVGRIINIVLSFLGVIAVVIILLGGFKWMTAAGNDEKVEEAKKLLGSGVIGLVIILAAWAISGFILGAIFNATTGS